MTGSWTIYRWGWQFTGSEGLDEAYVPSFSALGAAQNDAMVARWSANPLGMLWPEMDAAFVTSGGGLSTAARRPVVVIAGAEPRRMDLLQLSVAQGPAGNLTPAKDKSTERIDGIVALIMAIGRAMVAQEEPQPAYSMFFV
jgi:hypothetical protein